MLLKINLNKNVEQNAGVYYELAKKAKKKLEATKAAIKKLESEKEKLILREEEKKKKLQEKKEKRPLEWFEKLRWFISSEGFLCVGGRDSTTNELMIKKHTDKDDIVFHTEMAGSPFFVIKVLSNEGKTPGDATIKETGIATASFSRAWKLGVGFAEVYHIAPEQVSKSVQGAYLPKGSFMIYGKKNRMNSSLGLVIGVDNLGRVMCGPKDAIEKNCEKFATLLPGNMKASDAAKAILHQLDSPKGIDTDDIIRALPSGGVKVEAKAKAPKKR